jgi:hypothetical protein
MSDNEEELNLIMLPVRHMLDACRDDEIENCKKYAERIYFSVSKLLGVNGSIYDEKCPFYD